MIFRQPGAVLKIFIANWQLTPNRLATISPKIYFDIADLKLRLAPI